MGPTFDLTISSEIQKISEPFLYTICTANFKHLDPVTPVRIKEKYPQRRHVCDC